MTPIKRGTAHRTGLRLPSTYRQRWVIGDPIAPLLAGFARVNVASGKSEVRR